MQQVIDLLVSVSGDDNLLVSYYVPKFISSLKDKCNLKFINVFLVLRECLPVEEITRKLVYDSGFEVVSCPLPRADNCREDTSTVCNWMMDNCGKAEWAAISHYDIVFHSDYFKWVREVIPGVSIIGTHHDGIVVINRDDYRRCGVGFVGLDNMRAFYADGFWQITSEGHPKSHTSNVQPVLSMDVGELLDVRMATLGMRRAWNMRGNEPGKSDYFTHQREGSGHGRKNFRPVLDLFTTGI